MFQRIAMGSMMLLLAASTGVCHAEKPSQNLAIHLDPATTAVHFTLKDTIHTVHGSFRMKSGEITVDAKNQSAHGLIVIETATGESGNETRDGKMKKEFLEVTSFPVATYEVDQLNGLTTTPGTQTITTTGKFTLHGVTRPMSMTFTVNLATDGRATAKTNFKLPYVNWGIKNPSVPFVHVENEVTMDIDALGTVMVGK